MKVRYGDLIYGSVGENSRNQGKKSAPVYDLLQKT